MIISYNKKDKEITQLDATTFADSDTMERDIKTWIEKNPRILGEDFYIIVTEYNKFDKTKERPDILAIDRNGTLTVIEIKRDSSGKDIDLQAIKYAAYSSTLILERIVDINMKYLSEKGVNKNNKEIHKEIMNFISNPEFEELDGMPRIVLVAGEYTTEVTARVLWLKKFGLDIDCIRFKPYNFDNDIIVFESSVIIPLPEAEDYQIKPKNENLTEIQKDYLEFYTKIMEKIKIERPSLIFKYGRGKPYCQIQTNITRIHFEWLFHGKPRKSFGVEIHFEKIKKDENEKLFRKVLKLKDELKRETELTVIEDMNWPRIYIEKDQGNMNDDLVKWGVEKMIVFMNVINKVLDKLQTEDKL